MEKYQKHSKSDLNRRQFLGTFGKGVAVTSMVPLVGPYFIRSLMADDAQPGIPVVIFDLAGGAGLVGNVLVGGNGGPKDLLSSYNKLGWNPKKDQIDDRFGLPFANAGISKMFDSMIRTMSADAQARFRMLSVLNFSQDDTTSNPLSVLQLVHKVSNEYSISKKWNVKSGLGISNSLSGGRSSDPLKDATLRPLFLSKVEDLTGALGPAQLLRMIGTDGTSKLFDGLAGLANLQMKQLTSSPNFGTFRDRIQTTYSGLSNQLGIISKVDARLLPEAQAVYGINAQTQSTNRNAIIACAAANALLENSGPTVITIEGCDYHDGSSATGDGKDAEIGTEIGRVVELANRLKKPVFIQVLTDGGMYANEGTRKWASDAPDKSMTLMGVFHPNGPVKSNIPSYQIGRYLDGQGVDTSTAVGGSAIKGCAAVFANYLSCIGKLGDFNRFLPGIFSGDQLESIVAFDKIV